MGIHATATVAAEASIASSAEIGPYCLISGRVEIGEHTVVESHARIGGRFGTVGIGAHNYIQSGAVLGGPAQDLSYESADTALIIGDHNRIGEYVSINLGTVKGGGATRIGNRNFIMAYTHLGHDCQLEDDIVITNGSQLAGHVAIEGHALLGGLSGVTQFVRLGAYSFLTAGSHANKDVPPYTIAAGRWATLRATNRVGLKRAGFSTSQRRNIHHALKILLDRSLTIEDAVARIEADCAGGDAIEHMLRFMRASQRGIARA